MRLDEITAALSLDFEIIYDSEGDDNRGWTVHKIVASSGGTEVGYIKLSYIPSERFARYYPTIYHFLAQISGKTALIPSNEYEFEHYRKWPLEDLQKAIERIPLYGIRVEQFNGDDSSNAQLVEYLADVEAKLMKQREGREFKEFRNYFVDKPLVDYIRVHKEFRRQGIGIKLYLRGAQEMKKLGLRMHASRLQSEEAQAAWRHLEKHYQVGVDRDGRKYLEV